MTARPARDLAAPGQRLVVLYDRDCGLCTATARRLRRWDRAGRLELVPLQDAAGSARPALASMAARSLTAALHVLDERTGEVRAGGDAALAIAAALPGGALARPVAAIPPARWLVGVLYEAVARNRHRIGRWLDLEGPVCDVPR
ncbi:MAG TPA: DUF393 domain-containing protein [Candidatus Limnocylindrales bacterium]|nr:DUF393 domain-containing protein [Candidatus Limnocylindrales bacterium]